MTNEPNLGSRKVSHLGSMLGHLGIVANLFPRARVHAAVLMKACCRGFDANVHAAILAFTPLLTMAAAHAHDAYAWINDGNYKAADGTHCCGMNDCVEVKPSELAEAPGGMSTPFGMVDGRGVYQSRDGKAWVCRRHHGAAPKSSCAFMPGGG